MRVQDQTVIVTGASRGIGKATALELARRGANVVVVARSTEAVTVDAQTWPFLEGRGTVRVPGTVEETVAAASATGGTALGVVADVTSPEDRARVVAATLETFGRIDALVNNACYMLGPGFYRTLPELPLDEWTAQVETNLTAPVALIRAVLPHMCGRGSGVIVNLTTPDADLRPPRPGGHLVPGLGAPLGYTVTKAALNRLSNFLASQLLDTGVAVVGVDPRFTRTESVEHLRGVTDLPVEAAPPPELPARAIAHVLGLDDPMSLTGRIVVVPEVAAQWQLT